MKKFIQENFQSSRYKTKNLEITEEESYSDEEVLECHVHSNQKGIFYCDDCKYFLCKLCFANEHRSHRSNLPIDIAKEFKDNLTDLILSVNDVKPKIEESLKTISDLDSKIKGVRESSMKKLKDFIIKISGIMKNQNENNFVKFESIFEGLDTEIENIEKRLEGLLKKANKYITDFNEIKINLKAENNNEIAICEYRKKKNEDFF